QDSSTLDPGDSVSFTIPVVVTYEGECAHITNTASATASVAQGEVGGQVRADQVDEGLEGSDSWTVDVNCGGGGGGTNNPVLSVVKTPDTAQVDSGSQIGFTITLKNLGPGDAHGVTLSDAMPSVSGLQWQVGALPA